MIAADFKNQGNVQKIARELDWNMDKGGDQLAKTRETGLR